MKIPYLKTFCVYQLQSSKQITNLNDVGYPLYIYLNPVIYIKVYIGNPALVICYLWFCIFWEKRDWFAPVWYVLLKLIKSNIHHKNHHKVSGRLSIKCQGKALNFRIKPSVLLRFWFCKKHRKQKSSQYFEYLNNLLLM